MANIYPITWETDPNVIPTIDEYYLRAEDRLNRCIRALSGSVSPTTTLSRCMKSGGGCDADSFHDESGNAPQVEAANKILDRIGDLADAMGDYANSLKDQMIEEKGKEKKELKEALQKKIEEVENDKSFLETKADNFAKMAGDTDLSTDERIKYQNLYSNCLEGIAEDEKLLKELQDKLDMTEAISEEISGYIDSNGKFHAQNLSADAVAALDTLESSRVEQAENMPDNIANQEADMGFEEECGVVPVDEKLIPVDADYDGKINYYQDQYGNIHFLTDGGIYQDENGNWYWETGKYDLEVTQTYDSSRKPDAVDADHGYKPCYELDGNGYPKEVPQDFKIDSHEKLNFPGWGSVEPQGGEEIIFHYDPVTNTWYNLTYYERDNGGQTIEKFNPNSPYAYTMEEMNTYEVRGGFRPDWTGFGADGTEIVE